MEIVMEAEQLSYQINGKKIIDSVSFSIFKGEFVSIIGPNGAGKTTLMRCLSNSLKHIGTIRLKGRDIRTYDAKEKARAIAVVPQEYTLPFNFIVQDIVKMGRNPYLKKNQSLYEDQDDKVAIAMKQTGVEEFKHRYYNSLSGGEKQRVITARALAQDPEILFLDEFTSNLDVHNQLEAVEMVYELNRLKGLTVIAIMHDLNLAARFSDRILLLIDGKLEIFDVPEQVINEFVLSKAYRMEMIVRKNKLLNANEVIPIRVKGNQKKKNVKIHVISGGGTGEYILEKLTAMGYEVSCGILAEGDSDISVCESLGLEYISDDPFSSFKGESIHKLKKCLKKVDQIVVTDVPFGRNNLVNLMELASVPEKKISILHGVDRDYVGGEADELINQLKKRNNVIEAMNLDQLFKAI
jgi:iron complex transport system ATP-binding protein